MKRIALTIILAASSVLGWTQTTVRGSNVQDGSGNQLASGNWCFGSSCFSVTNGSFSGSVTPGTQTVTVVNGSSVTILSVSPVTIGSSTYNWSSYVVPYGGTFSGNGIPYLPCSLSSSYSQLDVVKTWLCVAQGSQTVWSTTGPPTAAGPGVISGVGVPTLTAVVPTIFVRTDTPSQYSLQGATGSVSSTWGLIAGSGSFTALTGDATSTSTGGATTVKGLNGVPFCTGFTPTNGQAVQYTTASSPNPCYTAATTSGGVTQITAGTNVTISPSGGTGNVTINASGGGSGTVSNCTSAGALAYYAAGGTTVGCATTPVTTDSSGNLNVPGKICTGGSCPTTGVSIAPLGTPTNWNFDTTSPATACASLGGCTVAGTGTATFAAGLGAGSGGSFVAPACATNYSCDSVSGTIALTTGTSPGAGQVVVTVTLGGVTRAHYPNCVGSVSNSSTDVPNATVLAIGSSTTQMVYFAPSALSANTPYQLIYVCAGS